MDVYLSALEGNYIFPDQLGCVEPTPTKFTRTAIIARRSSDSVLLHRGHYASYPHPLLWLLKNDSTSTDRGRVYRRVGPHSRYRRPKNGNPLYVATTQGLLSLPGTLWNQVPWLCVSSALYPLSAIPPSPKQTQFQNGGSRKQR